LLWRFGREGVSPAVIGQEKQHPFSKILKVVQMLSESGTNTFFFSDETL
jgi:hypothetical protein